MDFQQFRRYDCFLRRLRELNDLDDDGEFLVRIKIRSCLIRFQILLDTVVVLRAGMLNTECL